MLTSLIALTQLIFTFVIGIYFFDQLQLQHSSRKGIEQDTKRELERLNRMRKRALTEPFTEQTRPESLEEIIGQEDGVKAVKAALCGPNPQHILIYGPPGVGKTAAARVALEAAKKNPASPFSGDSRFIETDATTMQYDERSIADPLIGSVHDPIYQGAGAYGPAGVPQPKEGAVSRAHGGVLFIDEIGELPQMQMNRLLKVLEDRKVTFESAYYSSTDKNIPRHIHDIFENGIPADFRLVGATTRSPEEIPPAIRSRCVEIFFNPLKQSDLKKILENALEKVGITMDENCKMLLCNYAQNGRDIVKMLQTAVGIASLENRDTIYPSDVEWMLSEGHYQPHHEFYTETESRIGVVNGLAVTDAGIGMLMQIETAAMRVPHGTGSVRCCGIVDTERITKGAQSLQRTSTARSAVDNVMTVLEQKLSIPLSDYRIHINFPGGIPVDGPSAGLAILVSCLSAIRELPVDAKLAFTGEVSVCGGIKPVGGVSAKVQAAAAAGAEKVFIPAANMESRFSKLAIKVVGVTALEDALLEIFSKKESVPQNAGMLSAAAVQTALTDFRQMS